MDVLRMALRGDPRISLDVAAVEIAKIDATGVSTTHYLKLLDGFAESIAARLSPGAGGPAFIREMNRHLFDELGFRGNEADYYSPGNSCLNQVLDNRTGMPITLSVIYMEVARRLHRTVEGIGLPGHFVVQYRDQNYSALLDPFRQGRAYVVEGDTVDPDAMRAVSSAYIVARMLNNLRGSYFRVGDFRKAAGVLDLLIEASPGTAEYYKARAEARLRNREYMAANADFSAYLEHSPDALDRAEITKQLESIQRWLGSVN